MEEIKEKIGKFISNLINRKNLSQENDEDEITRARREKVEETIKVHNDLVESENMKKQIGIEARVLFIMPIVGICAVFGILGASTFICQILSLSTLAISEVTSIVKNAIEIIQNYYYEYEVTGHLNNILENGLDENKNGETATIRKNKKLKNLIDKCETLSDKDMVLNLLGKLMLIPECAGFLGTIAMQGKPYIGLGISLAALGANIATKVIRIKDSKEINEMSIKCAQISNELDLSEYYDEPIEDLEKTLIKGQNEKGETEKEITSGKGASSRNVKSVQKRFQKLASTIKPTTETTKSDTLAQQIEAIDDYVEQLAQGTLSDSNPMQKIKVY